MSIRRFPITLSLKGQTGFDVKKGKHCQHGLKTYDSAYIVSIDEHYNLTPIYGDEQ
jgi:hypothetical protein